MIELPFEPDPLLGADWLELSSFLDYPASISRIAVEGYFDDSKFEDSETLASDVFRHVAWRKSTSPKYPFDISNTIIRSKTEPSTALEYLFPLLLSTHGLYRETKITNWSHAGDLFELFCTASIAQLVGNAVLIGNKLGGLPSHFDKCLEKVCDIMNERKGPPHLKARDFKDAGVDIIAWRKFDRRRGQVVLLVQCASGSNWRKKGGDILTELWGELVFWTVKPPIKVLTFPYAYDFDSPEAEVEWSFYAYNAGLLLDRLRLSNFTISECKMDLNPLRRWVKKQMTTLKSHEIEC